MENEINLTIAPTTDGSPRDAQDLLHEGNPQLSTAETRPQTVVDVEHNPVQDDPRCWSSLRKVSEIIPCNPHTHTPRMEKLEFSILPQNFCLFLISSAATISGLAGSIQNREQCKLIYS